MGCAERIIDDFVKVGHARVRIDQQEADALADVLHRSGDFFRQPTGLKLRHSGEDYNFGYRPMGVEYSVTPERPDCNECFTLWSERLDLIPELPGVRPLVLALFS